MFAKHTSPASSYYNKLDATRCPVSNKLEFAQSGAHLQKLWQFWFPWSILCFRGSGLRMAPAVVPRVGERSNFKKIPTYTQDHGDGIATRGDSVVHVPS